MVSFLSHLLRWARAESQSGEELAGVLDALSRARAVVHPAGEVDGFGIAAASVIMDQAKTQSHVT